MSKLEKEQLQKTINQARSRLMKIEERELFAKHKDLLGRCFRYRNNYSCPKPNEHWWVFLRVRKVSGRWIYTDQFQTDYNGNSRIEPRVLMSNLTEGWQEISPSKYRAALDQLFKRAKKVLR